MTLLETQISSNAWINAWIPATWDEFVNIADKGEKRLQCEDLGIPEYWIVNVQKMQIIAFSIAAHASSRRIRESIVLPGLKLAILEQALQRSRQENQSVTTAWLMTQFQSE